MNGALEKNQRLTLSCARLGSELEGVCSYEGMAVFVPGVLPGETAEVQIVKALPNYAFGRLVKVTEPSPRRAEPRCPVYDKCGGCSGQHMTYEATLEAKRRQVWDCLNRIAGLLNTLEKMEKWKGNLYNWYHTITLSPMDPKVVSSVDSGNLCACLLALSTGLREQGREDLAQQALRLALDTDLGALYNKKKHLFYISYEPDTDTWSKAHYDLMASEARLLSYVALALGQVEHRHWGALSRAQTAAKGYQGMVSWFGTMFEYFMPHLLLPLPRDSFFYESLAFCACEQVRYGQKRSIPWGISESAVPALDQNGCYSYRANGIPAAALCYMPERPPVIAPYATYLTLSILPHRAVDNLQRLRSHGLGGKYGLYEAAEYSAGGIQAAKSWMSHHMGMSLLAIDNVLRDQIQIKRFMAQPELQAFQSLLEEEVPRNARPMRQKKKRSMDLGREKKPSDDYRLKGSGVQEEKPVCVLLPGANLSAVVTMM